MNSPLTHTTLIFAPKGRRPLALPLQAGQVVVVGDASGLLTSGWQESLKDNSASGEARIVRDGEILPQSSIKLVGFDISLPELTVREYLQSFCTDPDSIINEFELSEVAEHNCAYLPPAASRQIALLNAFSYERSIIVLNDPFLPFNGRWRESFAGFIAEQATLGGSAVICCNVGFTPKTWGTLPSVKMQDVAGLLPLPPELRAINNTQVPTTPQSTPVIPQLSTRQINENNAAYYAPGIPVPIPASAIKVYREVKDWIFSPIATASRFLRTWSGVVVTLSVAFLLSAMGIVLVPNLPQSQALLREIAKRFNYDSPADSPLPPKSEIEQKGSNTIVAEPNTENGRSESDDSAGAALTHSPSEPQTLEEASVVVQISNSNTPAVREDEYLTSSQLCPTLKLSCAPYSECKLSINSQTVEQVP